MNELNEWITKMVPLLTRWRRHLHQNAEVGFCEYVTTYYIYETLKSLDFPLFIGQDVLKNDVRLGVPNDEELAMHEKRAKEQGVPHSFLEKMKGGFTGLIAKLDTGKPGKHFAFRFDIDALPIEEAFEQNHRPSRESFRSKNNGMMHACGHDGHTAIGLGFAHFLQEHKHRLTGSFILIFQPAEEGCRGAKAIVEKGWLKNVDYFISGHIGIESLPVGTIVTSATDIFATTKMDVEIIGETAHAGIRPHEGKNALLAGSALALALHSIAPHGEGLTRINVGTLHAGSSRNVIAGNASLQLETRGASTKENNYMKEEAIRKIEGIAKMYDVDTTYTIVGEGISAETDSFWYDVILKATESSTFVKDVKETMQFNASEDATFMMKEVQNHGGKSVYMIYGTPLAAGHHHRLFDFDEGVLPVALSTLVELTWLLNRW